MNRFSWRRFAGLSTASILLIALASCHGCSRAKRPTPALDTTSHQSAAGQSGVPDNYHPILVESNEISTRQSSPSEPPAHYFYIDSLPRGAQIFLTDDKPSSKDEMLGMTPLRIEPSRVSGKKVAIMFRISELIQKMEHVATLNEETKKLRLDLEFAQSGDILSDFSFFDTPTSRFTQLPDRTSQAVGPLYEVDFSKASRICGYFVPRDVGVRKFYPLMPPKGSFHHSKADWTTMFKTELHLSDEQAREGVEVLSRAGRYQTIVPSRTAPDYEERVSVTVIGDPPDDEHIQIATKVTKVVKGTMP